MKDKEFIPSFDEEEEFRQGYRVYKLDPTPHFDRRYRLEFLLTLPGVMMIKDKDGRIAHQFKTYQNYVIKFTKSYNERISQLGIDPEKYENGFESLNPIIPLSKSLLKNIIGTINIDLPEPSPRDVYLELRGVFDKYIEVEPEVITLLSIYTVATYFFRLFNTFPYLYIFGPRQSGKTKLLALMTKLCYNAVSTVNLSASALFRVVNDFGSTLVIDESEYLKDMEKKSDIQTLLLAGYKKDTANVMRVEGEEKKQVRIFNVFGPKIMASINYPHDILLDRCIMINMLRGSSEKINLEPSESFQDIRDKLYLLLFTKFDEIYNMRDLDNFNNPLLVAREKELWRPLLVTATWLSQYLSDEEKAQLMADLDKVISDNYAKKTEMRTDSELNTLLYVLSKIVHEDGYVAVAIIRSALLDEYRDDENELRQVQKIWTPEKIGRLLTALKFQKKRKAEGIHYYIKVDDVKRLCQSYNVTMPEEESASQTELGGIDDGGNN